MMIYLIYIDLFDLMILDDLFDFYWFLTTFYWSPICCYDLEINEEISLRIKTQTLQ